MSARYHDKVVANAVIGTTESEAWAIGKRDGVDVITSDPVYHNNSKYYASVAEQHALRAVTAETNAKASETSAAESLSNATAQATAAAASAETATDKASEAATSASNAAESATASANSASSSSTSAQDSASSAASSANYASDSAESAAAASASQQAAETSETNAAAHATNANASSVAASKSETAAKTSETNAKSSETAAKTSETNASASESMAVSKASEALASASAAKISEENANTYYEKTKLLTDSITGALKPMGTVTFEDLPPLVDVSEGCMYNISNQFVTTSEFKEGAGTIVPIGSNVYKTSDGYWDILAGTPVAGVKGESESSYRTGNVNITKENIGLGNVDNTSDNEKSVLSATKLSTARKIGNASFDGTKDITLKETGALDPIGDEFNSSLTYAIGDFCIYNNTLYKCTTAIATASEWDGSKWEATTVAAELSLGSDNSVTLTRAEYDALSAEEKDSNTTYYISDEGAESNAFSVPFVSDKYTATNTGDALIEVKSEIDEVNNNLVKRDGSSNTINPVSDVNNFYSGIGLFNGATNTPSQDYWLILSSGYDGTVTQVAYSLWNSVTPKSRFCAARDWSEWKDLKQEQIDSIISSLNNKIKVTAITGSTGTGAGSGLLNVPRTDYPNAIAIIPFGYDHSFYYRVGAYDISSENFKFGVQLAVSGAWAENVTIVFNALVIE